jgi:hypothetical protein
MKRRLAWFTADRIVWICAIAAAGVTLWFVSDNSRPKISHFYFSPADMVAKEPLIIDWDAAPLVLPDILDPMPEVSYVRTFAFDIGVPPGDDHVEIVGKNVRCSACHTKDVSDAIWLMKLKLQRGIERAKAVKRGENPQW